MNIEPFSDDVAIQGPDVPDATNIDDLLKYCATIRKRFGNTAVVFHLGWGSSALHAQDKQSKEIDRLGILLSSVEAERNSLRAIVDSAYNKLMAAPELNPNNWTAKEALSLNDIVCEVCCDLEVLTTTGRKT